VKQFTVATTNPNKIYEIRSALEQLTDWQAMPQPETLAPVEETGTTFVENAILKAIQISGLVDGLVLGDDSGLCVDALDGRPGIFSARYAETADARISRVLTELTNVPRERRHARFICAMALARNRSLIWTTEGRVEGEIGFEPAGSGGFGYDPIFRLPHLGLTMAELALEEKNKISHRGLALQQLATYLNSVKNNP
jgi:XTP/dITP diphosphohydrolase